MNQPKIVFFGTPQFSATILEHLVNSKNFQVVGVVTNPDRPAGRKQKLTESPVAETAGKYHLPVFKPNKPDDSNLAHIKLLKPDLFIVAAYGQILPTSWLEAPSSGTVNVHYSLLPKYRGALCVSEAIKNCDKYTGVTLMQMDEKLDHGPIISQKEIEIAPDDNVATLTEKLTGASLPLLEKDLSQYLSGRIKPKIQQENEASYTPSFRERTRASAFIPWEQLREAMEGKNVKKMSCLIRSLNPDPGAWTKLPEKPLEIKLIQTEVVDDRLVLSKVQLPGKQPISWKQFSDGYLNS